MDEKISLWIRVFYTDDHENKHPNEVDVQLDTHVALLEPISHFDVLSQAKQQ